ncbi:MAG: hypothetical protein A2464_12285 [Deltaproteobacteria bacterium RIFOXYC2_FULL_48_10]|nr:MAG: hypothetical protein A2464_12285 [Deltaproteobacteria bacterium RIFOXYC2_FULL_48_10]
MNREREAIHILGLIFNVASEKKNYLSDSNELYTFFTIPGQGNLRWIVPEDPRFGIPVLCQWRPYKPWSYIKWKLILFLYSKRLLKKIQGISTLKFTPYKTHSQDTKPRQRLVPVIYVGTPGTHQKAVATFINPVTGIPVNVVKVALKKSAVENLTREAEMLKKIAEFNVPGIPKIISIENNGAKTVQTVIPGRLTSRKLTKAHINWLLKLPRFEKTTTFDEQKQIIQGVLAKQQSAFTEMERNSIHTVSKTLQGKGLIPYLIIHGDFAPWNLKRLTNDEITAIDWEDSDLNGLPLWDLSHFFCIQAHLFGGPNPFKKIRECPLVALYIKKIGLDQNNIRQFYTLYLIKKFIGSGLFSTNSYGAFLIQQIHQISQQ